MEDKVTIIQTSDTSEGTTIKLAPDVAYIEAHFEDRHVSRVTVKMKEITMTQEEKAKRDDEAIERYKAKQEYESQKVHEFIEYLFPELRESEDERIKNYIISCLNNQLFTDGSQADIDRKNAIAWLEKQGKNNMGISEATKKKLEDSLNKALEKETPESWNKFLDEQKPADKAEPKFKVGEWLVHKDLVGVTFCITQIHAPHYYLTNKNSFVKFGEEDNYRPWTIQDAKDGDVLVVNDNTQYQWIGIFKEHTGCTFTSYCHYNTGMDEFITNKARCRNHGTGKYSNIHPATKEQRDKLEKAMADAGYTFDFEKKELKKIEQKHTPKHRVGDTIYYNSFGELKSMIVANVVTDSTDNPMYEDKEGNAVFEKDIIEQKPTWSEEDELRMENILSVIEGYGYPMEVDWLKSLRPQKHWKPSDLQIRILELAIDYWKPNDVSVTTSLYNLLEQLKKLREK